MRKLTITCTSLVILAALGCTRPPIASRALQLAGLQLKTQINHLLNQLASDKFRTRENAQAELKELLKNKGGALLEKLRKAHTSAEDPEAKVRLKRILEPYERWRITPQALRAVPNLLAILEEGSQKGIRNAIEALRKLDPEHNRGILFSILSREDYCGQRRATEVLIEQADAEVVQFFIRLIPVEKSLASYALVRIGEESIGPVEKLLYQAKDRLVRIYASETLAQIGAKGIQKLLHAVRTGSPEVKAAALIELSLHSKDTLSLDSLLVFIGDESAELRSAATYCLRSFTDKEAVDALLLALKQDADPKVRSRAAWALPCTGGKDAVPALMAALKDSSLEVRKEAAKSLGELNDGRAVKALLEFINTPEDTFRYEVNRALESLAYHATTQMVSKYRTASLPVRLYIVSLYHGIQDLEAVPMLMEALEDDSSKIRAKAAEALGWLRAEGAAEALLKALKDSESCVRAEATEALGNIRDKRAINALMAVLDDKDEDVRSRAVSSLAALAGRDAIGVFKKALEDENEKVRSAGLRALSGIRDQDAVSLAVKAIKDPSEEVQRAAIYNLSRTGDKKAFELLVTLFKSEEPLENEYLVRVLARTGGNKAIPYLIKAFAGSEETPYEAVSQIIKFGETAIPPLLKAVKSDNPAIKANVLEALAMLRDETAFVLHIRGLKDKDQGVRRAAAEMLPLYRDARAVEPLIGSLADDSREVVIAAISSLKRLRDKRAVQPLIEILLEYENSSIDEEEEYDDDDVREAAAEALGSLGETEAVEPLVLCLLDDWFSLSCAAAEALGKFKDNRAINAVLITLKDCDYFVRKRVAVSLAKTGDHRATMAAIEAYRGGLRDRDILKALRESHAGKAADLFLWVLANQKDYYREEAACALGEIGDKRAIKPLKALLASDNSTLRLAAATALLQFDDREAAEIIRRSLADNDSASDAAQAIGNSPHPRAYPWLVDAMNSEDSSARWAVAEALGKLGDKRAFSILVSALSDKDDSVRWYAAEALAKLKDERAVRPLIEIFVTDPDDYVREAAHDALHEITGRNFGWNYQRWRRWYESCKR